MNNESVAASLSKSLSLYDDEDTIRRESTAVFISRPIDLRVLL